MSRCSLTEEVAGSVTHGAGIALGIAGLALLAPWAALHGGPPAVTTAGMFGTTLILVYAASTAVPHAIPIAAARPVLRTLDHIAIWPQCTFLRTGESSDLSTASLSLHR